MLLLPIKKKWYDMILSGEKTIQGLKVCSGASGYFEA